jgi:hypothetical protein
VVVGFAMYGRWTFQTAWRNHRPLRRTAEPAPDAGAAVDTAL